MKLWTLMENTTERADLICEHGLSLYLETGNHRILFDAGQTDAFADNAQKMGVDLGGVEFAVLSHGHYDHGGGLYRFRKINPAAPIYVNRDAFYPHYNGTEKYIGLNPAWMDCKPLIFTENSRSICQGISLHTCNGFIRPFPTDSIGMNVRIQGEFLPDDFRHEQYLLIEEKGKRILLSGCSHKGIMNIVHWLRPDVLIGGFHFKRLEPVGLGAERLRAAAETLLQYPTVYYTGHCTGTAQFCFLKQIMGDRLHGIETGSLVEL